MKLIAQFSQSVALVLIAGALVFVGFVGQQFVTQQKNAARLQGMHDCAQDYQLSYTETKTGTTVSQPIVDLYQECLGEKGLQ